MNQFGELYLSYTNYNRQLLEKEYLEFEHEESIHHVDAFPYGL